MKELDILNCKISKACDVFGQGEIPLESKECRQLEDELWEAEERRKDAEEEIEHE